MTKRVRFVVNVWVVDRDKDEYKTVAWNIKLREPAWYKEAVMKSEALKQHPKLIPLVEGKGWGVDVVEWYIW